MFWQRWPVWPLVCSVWLHALVLAFPVAFGPRASSLGADVVEPFEVRLSKLASREQPERAVPGTAQTAAVVRLDSAPREAAPPLMPNQPPIAFVLPDRYFSSSEVDRKAEALEVAPLIYPEEAYLRRLHGKLTLRLYINETGAIDSIDILASDPPGMFDQAALDAVLATRFRPALLLGRPVKNIKTIEIELDPLVDR